MADEQQQGQALDLSNYAKRKAAGMLEWKKNDEGQVVLAINQYNSAQEKVGTVEFIFSSIQLRKIRNQREQTVLTMRQQILDIEQQIADIEREDVTLYDELAREVEALETTGEPLDAQV